MAGIKPGQEECLAGDKAYFGHGVPQDFGAALQFYRAAADQHYPPAINSLATMYREGKGTPKDLPTAIEWYKKAAALSNLDAINNLGQMHEAGEGVTKNLET
jgi:TPR repeat protein